MATAASVGASTSPSPDVSRYFANRRRIWAAAHHVQNALHGLNAPLPRDADTARRAYDRHIALVAPVRTVLWALLFSTFFQRPGWCARRQAADPTFTCEGNPQYPTFSGPYAPACAMVAFEASCLTAVSYDLALQYMAHGRALHRRRGLRWYSATVLVVLLEFCWSCVAFPRHLRPAPVLRAALAVLHTQPLHGPLRTVARALPRFGSVVLLLAIYIALFAAIALFVFAPVRRGPDFASLPAGVWSLFVCLTAANFPDIMMPLYTQSRSTCLFFVVYLLFGLFFGLNYVFAMTYQAWTEQHREERRARLRRRAAGLLKAFELLADGEHGVARSRVLEVLWQLSQRPHYMCIDTAQAQLLLAVLTGPSAVTVTKTEFSGLCDVLSLRFARVAPPAPFGARHPRLSRLAIFRAVEHRRFEQAVDGVLVVLVLLTALEMVTEPLWPWLRVPGWWLRLQDVVLMALFAVEAFVKIVSRTWGEYWRVPRNRFDFTVAAACAAAVAVAYSPMFPVSPRLIRTVLILRLLRLLRLLRGSRAQRVVQVLSEALPEARRLLHLLFVLVFVFGALGVLRYGGRLNSDPLSPYSHRLRGTRYAAAGYYALNFNDLPSAVVTVFCFMVMNRWWVFVEALVAVGGPWDRAFFLAFYVLGVLMGTNLVISCIVAATMRQLEQPGEADGGARAPHFGAPVAVVNAAALAGGATPPEGDWHVYWCPPEGLEVPWCSAGLRQRVLQRGLAFQSPRIGSASDVSMTVQDTAAAAPIHGPAPDPLASAEPPVARAAPSPVAGDAAVRDAVGLLTEALQSRRAPPPRLSASADRLQRRLRRLSACAAWAYLCLTFFEEPRWRAAAMRQYGDTTPALFPTFVQQFLSPRRALAAEVALLAVLGASVALRVGARGYVRRR